MICRIVRWHIITKHRNLLGWFSNALINFVEWFGLVDGIVYSSVLFRKAKGPNEMGCDGISIFSSHRVPKNEQFISLTFQKWENGSMLYIY